MKSYVEIKLIIDKNLLETSITYYKFLVPVFKNLDPEFKVKINPNQTYNEFMTNLVTSEFVNTFEYLEQQTDLGTVELVKPYFESLDYQLKTALAQIYQAIEQAQNMVSEQNFFLEDLQGWQIKIYQDYFEIVKKLLGRIAIPELLKLILKTPTDQLKNALFQHQINEFFFEFKNKLSDQVMSLLETYLTKIYDQYGLTDKYEDLVDDDSTNDAFSDFDDFNFFEVDNVDSALQVFNLSKNVSFKEIQHAYKQLAKKYHPDSHSLNASAVKMQQINLAYQILKTAYQTEQ